MIKYYKDIPSDCVKELRFYKRWVNFLLCWPILTHHIAKFLLTKDGKKSFGVISFFLYLIVYPMILGPCWLMFALEYNFRINKDKTPMDRMIGYTIHGYSSFFSMKKELAIFKLENPRWNKKDNDDNQTESY